MLEIEPPKNIEEIYEGVVEEATPDPEALEQEDGLEEDSSELPVDEEADVELEEEEDDEEDDSEFDQEVFGDEEEESDETEESEETEHEEENYDEDDDEVTRLRDLLAQQQQMNAQLVEHMKQQQKPAPKPDGQVQRQQPRRTLEQSQFEDAFRLILYGNTSDKEEFESLPPPIRKQAAEAASHYSKESSLNAIYPQRRYESQIKFFVQREIDNAVKDLRQDFHDRKAKDVFEPYANTITDPEDRKRLGEIMLQMPGADSTDWNVQKRVLDLAVKEVLREKEYADLKNRTQDLEAKERQFKAAKRSRRRGRGRQNNAQTREIPTLKPGMDLVEYAQFLRKGE